MSKSVLFIWSTLLSHFTQNCHPWLHVKDKAKEREGEGRWGNLEQCGTKNNILSLSLLHIQTHTDTTHKHTCRKPVFCYRKEKDTLCCSVRYGRFGCYDKIDCNVISFSNTKPPLHTHKHNTVKVIIGNNYECNSREKLAWIIVRHFGSHFHKIHIFITSFKLKQKYKSIRGIWWDINTDPTLSVTALLL